ncbi:MAG TPA: twin-arginine translocation signal domain-containing protein, partial [Burkholderiales bacterium]|nr:twin-arginine translocation signal domain-containing protein [Burkholderiales bacterium]
MAATNRCGSFACAHLACGEGANAVNLGRREFLKETAATAGFAGLVLSGCETPAPVQASASPADVLITNARIATLNPRAPAAGAIAIRGGEIAAIGSAADVEKLRGAGTQVIDAGGRTIIPGLNDGHTHFIRGGLTYT